MSNHKTKETNAFISITLRISISAGKASSNALVDLDNASSGSRLSWISIFKMNNGEAPINKIFSIYF